MARSSDRPGSRTMFALMPFSKELKPTEEALRHVAAELDFGYSDPKHLPDTNVVRAIIRGIQRSDLIVVDLTYLNPNVLYELGIAHALSKSCILICQRCPQEERDKPWITAPGECGNIPFNIHGLQVIPYDPSPEGMKALERELIGRFDSFRGRAIGQSFNHALDELIRRDRLARHLLWGMCVGFAFGVVPSLITAAIGASFTWDYHAHDQVFRIVFEGCVGGLFMGGAAYLSYAMASNLSDSNPSRLTILVAEFLGGCVAGLLIAAVLFLLDYSEFGTGVAGAYSVGLGIIPALGGVALGLSLNNQPPLEKREAFASYVARSVLAFGFVFLITVGIFHIGRSLFAPIFQRDFELVDAAADALRYAVWGVTVAAFHWRLKWEKKI